MTGRGAGFCAGYGVPGHMNGGWGRGFGMGFGRGGGGRGWRHRFYATGVPGWMQAAGAGSWAAPAAPTREQELDALKGQAEYFENALGELRKRIEELEAEKTEK